MLLPDLDFLNFCLTASIFSLWGILVYKERTSNETK